MKITLASIVLVVLISCAPGKSLGQSAVQAVLINGQDRLRSGASVTVPLFELTAAPSSAGSDHDGLSINFECKGAESFVDCNGVAENDPGNLHTMAPHRVMNVSLYGLYATYSSTTCTTTAGSATVTLGSVSNFKNGEYATCYNAGPATTAVTPRRVTVTSGVNAGGQGEFTPNANGSTTASYQVVAEDSHNGRSAASSAASTSTGAHANGLVTCRPMAWSRSATVVTITTSGCSLVALQQIWVQGASDPSVNGNWQSTSPTNGTAITFRSNFSTLNGAVSSGTFISGSVTGWRVNHITWSYNSANFRYHIYGPKCPTICNWMGQTVQNFWDDYGSTMEAEQTQPPYIPAAAPSSAANQHFTFRISSGGGTATLTASTTAGASVSSNIIVSDAGPALIAAAAAAKPSGSLSASAVYIPTLRFIPQINSYTDFSSLSYAVRLTLGGWLQLNNTLANVAYLETENVGANSPSFGFFNVPPLYSAGAYPALYYANGGGYLHNVYLYGNLGNGYLGIYSIDPVNWTADGLQIGMSGSTSDCTGLAALYTTIGNGVVGFFTTLNRTLLSSGVCNGAKVGTSPFPNVIMTTNTASGGNSPISSFSLTQAWFVNRGGIQIDTQGVSLGGATINAKDVWTQSLTNSAFSVAGNSTGGMDAILDDILMADYTAPILTAYHIFNGPIYARNIYANPGISWYTGGVVTGGISGAPATPQTGVNYGTAGIVGGFLSDGVNWILGAIGNGGPGVQFQVAADFATAPNFGIHTTALPPAAPTCTTIPGGPPYVRAGTYTFAYATAYAPNGGIGNLSPASNSCTANGTSQQMSLTIPTAVPGAIGYYWYVSKGSGFFGLNGSASRELTYKWNGVGNGNSRETFAAGGPAGMQNGQLWGKQIITIGTETTLTQCFSSASPATCGSNIDGFVAIPAGRSSVVVDTTTVTANSEISLTFDSSQGRSLGLVCNTRPQQPYISARTAGRSFTISVPSIFEANPGCIGFHLKN